MSLQPHEIERNQIENQNTDLTDSELVDVERLFLESIHSTGEIPNTIEYDYSERDEYLFEEFTEDEIFTSHELKAIALIIEEDKMFDFPFEEFYMFYIELAGQIRTKHILEKGESLIDTLPRLLDAMAVA
ncbi:MAG: hypothetical protein GQ474_01590 [Sulfurimonas sp.]|nr:hypothetical protein [Sulfurimonas sp.]